MKQLYSRFTLLLLAASLSIASPADTFLEEYEDGVRPEQEVLFVDDKVLNSVDFNAHQSEQRPDGDVTSELYTLENEDEVSDHGAVFVPSSTPEDASPPVDPDFIGFAFEIASFARYVLTRDRKEPNSFTVNLIDAIMSRTGGKPIVRLGGTAADFAKYIPTQEEPVWPLAEKDTHQNPPEGETIGPRYWDLTHIIPNSVYVIQVPMANTNMSETLVWARTAAERVGLDRIHSFEPGNEADIYSNGGLRRPPAYQGKMTNETYTGNFTKYANAVKDELGLEGPWFQAFDTGAHVGKDVLETRYILDVETNFNLGINDGNIVKTVASHWYQTTGGKASDLSDHLMQHSRIAWRSDLLLRFINYLRSNHPHIPFIISEVGNSLIHTYNHAYQAVLGSALWSVDFQLYTMSIGVARINWQSLMHAGYSMWLPIDSAGFERQTFSSFYAMPFVADFIGKGGRTRAAQLETGFKNIPAYAAYVDDQLARVAIVNMRFWDLGMGERPKITIALDVPSRCETVRLDLLSSPQGAHAYAENITYAGSQWTSASEGKEVKGVWNDSRVLDCEDGKVYVDVWNSQAALIHFL